jgi:hypothetical protein
MKNLLFLLLTSLSALPAMAQGEIKLPALKKDVYAKDTLVTCYLNDETDFSLAPSLQSGFITGMEFKIIVDSVQIPGATDVQKGDVLSFPTTIHVFNGVVHVLIVLQGIPQIGGESYSCYIEADFLTDNTDNGIVINPDYFDNSTCTVSTLQAVAEHHRTDYTLFNPNPFSQTTQLNYDASLGPVELILFNKQGLVIKSIVADKGIIQLAKDNLSPGLYFYQLKNNTSLLSSGKVMVE